ncbi:MAG: multidrug efflux pump subunit AcrA (membrane-fusion protein) [Candidatus Azotimanducaceae bacterium]
MCVEQEYVDKKSRCLSPQVLLAERCHKVWSRLSLGGCLVLLAASVQSQQPNDVCVIHPSFVVDLRSPFPGIIRKVMVEQGDFVVEGQALAQMEDRVERVIVELARTSKAIPVDNNDNSDRTDEQAHAAPLQLQQMESLQRVRTRALDRAEALLEQKVVRSPIDGFVVNSFRSEGEFVEEQTILRVAQLNPLLIKATIPQKYFNLVQPGMTVEVKPSLADSSLRRAQVIVVDQVEDPVSGTFGVRLEMLNAGSVIPAGIGCEVNFPALDASLVASDGVAEAEAVPDQRTSYTLGPFLSIETLNKATGLLEGLDVTVREETVAEDDSYIVLLTAEGSVAEQQLEKSGLTDFYYNKKPPYTGRYSLGVFGARDNAYSLAAKTEKKGVPTEVLKRDLDRTFWWLDLLLSKEDMEISAEVRQRILRVKEKI